MAEAAGGCDVLIVGAGAAGTLYAAKLAQAGKSVRVLEAGPARTMDDLVSSQIWARRLKWGGAPVEQTPPIGHNALYGSGFGGAALHHYGTWPRPTEDTFRLRSLYGVGLDWPFGYDELRPYYDRIQSEVGVAGDAAAEHQWRPPGEPYPMPPLPTFRQGEILKSGFDRLGLATAPLPAAINTVPYRGRAACIYDGWCDAGCPITALANPLATHFPQAQRAGAVFTAGATATRVLMDRGRAIGVAYADAHGTSRRIEASVIVLAGSAIQNPRLLLNSAYGQAPSGLANASGLVGAYFSVEPSAHVFGLFAEATAVHQGVSAGQRIHRSAHSGHGRRPDGAYQWQIAPAMKPNDLFGVAFTRPDLYGAPFDAFIRRGAAHMASMASFGADIPQRANRVQLSSGKDAFGSPLAEVRCAYSPAGEALWAHMRDEGLAILKAAGAQEAWASPLSPGHMSGGTIMGEDPATSVVDGHGRAHDVPNLFVAGAGLYPHNGGASPTFTLYAVGLRSVERLISHWRDYAA